jgi:hypothetical protein
MTSLQVNASGPLQPAGSVLKLPEMPNPVIDRPSLEANVMPIVWFEPTATDTLEFEAVAMTVSSVPVVPLSPPTPPLGLVAVPLPPVPPVPPVLPARLAAPYAVPLLLLPQGELMSQPDTARSVARLKRSDR